MHLVKYDQAPLPVGDAIHAALRPAAALFAVADHVVGGDGDGARAVAAAAREHRYIAFGQSGPLEELLLPLRGSHRRAAYDQRCLLERGCSCDADERLACTAGQHDDAAVGRAAGEELGEAALLVRAQHAVAAEADPQ